MEIKEWLRANAPLHKNKDGLIEAGMKEFNLPRGIINKKILSTRETRDPIVFGNVISENPVQNNKFKGLSESEIRAKHDIKFIFGNAVKELEKGLYISDADFVRQCDIKSHVGYRQMLDDPEFKKYKGRAGGITYWSHPESIEKMKNEGILT
jgi:hypothetical protein